MGYRLNGPCGQIGKYEFNCQFGEATKFPFFLAAGEGGWVCSVKNAQKNRGSVPRKRKNIH